MAVYERWLLPDGVDELLPPQAVAVETLRRKLLDQARTWGYELVAPPLIEFLDSLLTGTGNDLALQTFKVTDQLSGRLMGVRADITPQAARIDARRLHNDSVTRLCYADTVLHARPAHMMTGRCPLQFGCELFGEPGLIADVEAISLMIESLLVSGQQAIHVDLAHVGIYRGLIGEASLSVDMESKVFDALRRKSVPELDELLGDDALVPESARMLRYMASIAGGPEALTALRAKVGGVSAEVDAAIDDLELVAQKIKQRYPSLEIGFDFCELRGYNYHTGLVFAAYVPGYGHSVAQGGRYDSIGQDFGLARPATGFSLDIKVLAAISELSVDGDRTVYAPLLDDAGLWRAISGLRSGGERVVQCAEVVSVAGHRQLVLENGQWVVRAIGE